MDDSGKLGDSPFSRVSRICHLHECDIQIVGLAVDLLQFRVHIFTLLTVVLIWKI